MEVDKLRKDYSQSVLHKKDLLASPFDQLRSWLEFAIQNEVSEPNAMTLATCSRDGHPSNRNVLLRALDDQGLVFFTDYRSRKARDIQENPFVAVVFWWNALEKQVLVRGRAEKISAQESDTYFASRPRKSQLATWASQQDEPVATRDQLEAAFSKYEQQFEGRIVPRPDYWGGFRIEPDHFEFWQGRRSRLHDRFAYNLSNGLWHIQRLSP